ECVEELTPVDVAQVRAVAGFEDGHPAALVRAQFRDGVDQVLAVELDEGGLWHGDGRVLAVPILSSGTRRGLRSGRCNEAAISFRAANPHFLLRLVARA